MVTVYTRPGCVQCHASLREFTKHGLAVHSVDVSTDPAAADRLHALGYRAVPVIVTADGQHWSGYRPDRIAALR